MESLGFEVIQVYGLGTYGLMIVSEWRDWNTYLEKKPAKSAPRSSIDYGRLMMVGDPSTMEAVPWDGETKGEVFMRGNIVILKNKKTTKCFEGWFHSETLLYVTLTVT